jgi:hypothetical protein
MLNIEIVTSHIRLLVQGMPPDQQEGFPAVTKRLPGFAILYREGTDEYVPGSRRW